MSAEFAKALEFIEDMTHNSDKVQERVLAEILARNAETEYLRRFNMNGSTDRDVFKSKIPVMTYDDIQPDIQRIANGDRSPILSSHPISEFLTRKLMPTIADEMDRKQKLYSLLTPVIDKYVPDLDKGKFLYFLFTKSETKTPSGLVARPALTSYYKSDQFRNRPYDPYNVYTSPDVAILCPDTYQSMYTQVLCGLLMREQVLCVGAVLASGLLRAIRFLQVNWRQLAHDISTGTLNAKITDPGIRKHMEGTLYPNQELAGLITKECEGEDWERIIPRIWPNTKYLLAILTGAMAQYIPLLDFYSGNLPQACTLYASSECYFGLNLEPMTKPSEAVYTIMPNMAYFEFILQEDPSPGPVVDLADVEVGKEYELVVTTYSGLCRYRVGDVLRAAGFYNSAPQFKFVRRKNVLLSIDADKTDESELQRAVENASALLHRFDATVVDYTSYADASMTPGHYVIYWELMAKGDFPTEEVLESCCLEMEEAMNSVYRQCRVSDNSIGPLEIRVVKSGTFEELMDYAISRGASIGQYKGPRCVSFPPIVELLDSRVVSRHFSPCPPKWSPERNI